jgi:hypothetical protein
MARKQPSRDDIAMDWAWGEEAQFRSDVVPQVGLDDYTLKTEVLHVPL